MAKKCGELPKYQRGRIEIFVIPMSRRKPLVLTFDAFGTLFTPREPIGQQYVRTIPLFPYILRLDTWVGAVKHDFRQGLPLSIVLTRPADSEG